MGSNAVSVLLCATVWWGRTRVRTITEGRAISVFLVLAIASVMTVYTVAEHASWLMLTSGLITLLAGGSLLVPVGTTAQAITAAGTITIYSAPLIAGVRSDAPLGLPLVALVSGAGVSVLGAYLTERYREEVTAASAAARSVADVATTLIEIGRELNATLNRSEVLRRLANRAAEVFGAPIGAINLIDEDHRLRIAAATGLSDEETHAARELYLDLDGIPGAWEILAAPLIEVPDVGAQDRLPPALLQQFGYHGLLIAPMHRGTKILGAV
ncbi:MAG: GAF domain-containing protein [Gaiellaceae bacterium]